MEEQGQGPPAFAGGHLDEQVNHLHTGATKQELSVKQTQSRRNGLEQNSLRASCQGCGHTHPLRGPILRYPATERCEEVEANRCTSGAWQVLP